MLEVVFALVAAVLLAAAFAIGFFGGWKLLERDRALTNLLYGIVMLALISALAVLLFAETMPFTAVFLGVTLAGATLGALPPICAITPRRAIPELPLF